MVGMHRLCCTGAVQRRDRNDIVAALRDGAKQEKYTAAVDIIRQLALTGCRRSEMIGLKWTEADTEVSYLRLEDSKEGESIRLIGLPVVEYIERRRTDDVGACVFPRQGEDNTLGSFPNHWEHLFEDSPLSDVTPHVLRHNFASIANDLGFTEVTIAALVGHAKGSVTSKDIHTPDTALIMAADRISGYIQGLLDGIEFKQTAHALDRDSRKAAPARFLKRAAGVTKRRSKRSADRLLGAAPSRHSTSAAATGSPNADGRIGAPEFRDSPALGVNRRSRLTPPSLGRSIAWLADRRRDPMPINILSMRRHAESAKPRNTTAGTIVKPVVGSAPTRMRCSTLDRCKATWFRQASVKRLFDASVLN
jgi:hypothetical protein